MTTTLLGMTEHKEHIRFCTSDFQNCIKQNIEIVFFFSKYNSQMCYEMFQHVNTRICIRNSIERSDFGT
jgi:hypothetical protein